MSKGTITGGGEDGLYNVTIDLTDGPNGIPATLSDFAWCADLTEDLSGSVGILEIAGDLNKGFNIQPGYEGNAVYNAARDGAMKQVQPFPDTKPTGEVYWNWAMRPGWQKWRPNYRYGEISNIDYDADTCNVALDPCYASDAPDGMDLDINQAATLEGVSIEYMSCNSLAFSNGDRVIVKFENNNWNTPKVIGFETDPKPCTWEDWGDTLCENHVWATSFAAPGGRCPALPISFAHGNGSTEISLTDGVLHYANLGVTYGGGNFIEWKSTDDNGKTPPKVGTMKIKIGAESSDFAGLYIYTAPTEYITINFDGSSIGSEQTINLVSLGLDGGVDITRILIVNTAAAGGSTELNIDSISFYL